MVVYCTGDVFKFFVLSLAWKNHCDVCITKNMCESSNLAVQCCFLQCEEKCDGEKESAGNLNLWPSLSFVGRRILVQFAHANCVHVNAVYQVMPDAALSHC